MIDVVIDMISFNEEDADSAIRAFEGRIQHFIQCSTVMTYGPPFPRNGINITENDYLNGKSAYALGKIAADNLLLKSYLEDDFPVTILKPSYTYGPGVNVHRQIGGDGSWIDRLRKGKPILSAGDGLNLFQFLSSHDAGEVYLKWLDLLDSEDFLLLCYLKDNSIESKKVVLEMKTDPEKHLSVEFDIKSIFQFQETAIDNVIKMIEKERNSKKSSEQKKSRETHF